MIPPKTKRTLDHFCKNTVISYLFPVRPGRGRDPRAASAQAAGAARGRRRGPWPPCPPRVFGRGTQGRWEALRHAPHGARPRRAPDDRRRSEARTPCSPDSGQPNAPASAYPGHAPAQHSRALQHRFSHITRTYVQHEHVVRLRAVSTPSPGHAKPPADGMRVTHMDIWTCIMHLRHSETSYRTRPMGPGQSLHVHPSREYAASPLSAVQRPHRILSSPIST